MKPSEHGAFWAEYDRAVRPAVERACRRVSRLRASGTMEPGDMASWVHTRVWRMLERSAYPAFHDDPSVGEAVARLIAHAPTLARWSYLALSRRHWRSMEREAAVGSERVERLSVTRRAACELERREELDGALEKVREALPLAVRQKLAASMADGTERRRAAMALGVTRAEDEALMDRIDGGGVKENTVQQMRSRARRYAAEALGHAIRLPLMLVVGGVLLLAAAPAEGGEQSGGRKGSSARAALVDPGADAEQTGGRIAGVFTRGEQSGGRGGKV